MVKSRQILKIIVFTSLLAGGVIFGVAQAQYNDTTVVQPEVNFDIHFTPYVPMSSPALPVAAPKVPQAAPAATGKGKESNVVGFTVTASNRLPSVSRGLTVPISESSIAPLQSNSIGTGLTVPQSESIRGTFGPNYLQGNIFLSPSADGTEVVVGPAVAPVAEELNDKVSAVSVPSITTVVSVTAAVRSYIDRARILLGFLPQTQQVIIPVSSVAEKGGAGTVSAEKPLVDKYQPIVDLTMVADKLSRGIGPDLGLQAPEFVLSRPKSVASAPAPAVTPTISVAEAVRSYIDRARILLGFVPQSRRAAVLTPSVAPQELAAAQAFATEIAPIVSDLKDQTVALRDELVKDVLHPFNDEKVLAGAVFAPFFAKPDVRGGLFGGVGSLDQDIEKLEKQIKDLENNSIVRDNTAAFQKTLADLRSELKAKQLVKKILDKIKSGTLTDVDLCLALREFIAAQIIPQIEAKLAVEKDELTISKFKEFIKLIRKFANDPQCTYLRDVIRELSKPPLGGIVRTELEKQGILSLFDEIDKLLSELSGRDGFLDLVAQVVKGISVLSDNTAAAKAAAEQAMRDVDALERGKSSLVPDIGGALKALKDKFLDYYGCSQTSPTSKRDVELSMRNALQTAIKRMLLEKLAETKGSLSVADIQRLDNATSVNSTDEFREGALSELIKGIAGDKSGIPAGEAAIRVLTIVEFWKSAQLYQYDCGRKSNLADMWRSATQKVKADIDSGRFKKQRLSTWFDVLNIRLSLITYGGSSELDTTKKDSVAGKVFNVMETIDKMVDLVEGPGLDMVKRAKDAIDAAEKKQQAQVGK